MGGVKKTISKIFGGGSSSAPAPVIVQPEPVEPAPTQAVAGEPQAAETTKVETQRNRNRRGTSSAVLTSPLGTTGNVMVASNKLGGV